MASWNKVILLVILLFLLLLLLNLLLLLLLLLLVFLLLKYSQSVMTDSLNNILEEFAIWLLRYWIEFSCLYSSQGQYFISTLWLWEKCDFLLFLFLAKVHLSVSKYYIPMVTEIVLGRYSDVSSYTVYANSN